MGAYTTKQITREEAIDLIAECKATEYKNLLNKFTVQDLEETLDEYAHSENFTDVLGVLYDFQITK